MYDLLDKVYIIWCESIIFIDLVLYLESIVKVYIVGVFKVFVY